VIAVTCALNLLTGCGLGSIVTDTSPERTPLAISGVVHGGQNPVSGSLVQLWETGGTNAASPATATATVASAAPHGIASITLNSGGNYGYTSAPTVTIADSGAGVGTGATATANVANGSVTSITVTAAGSNYTTPVVTLSGGLATNGYGSGSTTLIASTTTATTTGAFSFPTANVSSNCKTGPFSYITATGGDPSGTTTTNTNPGIVLVAVLGNCSTTGASTNVTINELTTVAAAYALSGFATDSSGTVSVGTTLTNAQGLADAVANAGLLVNSSTGHANASTSTRLLPTATVNTLADALAVCVNSAYTGGSYTTPSTACTNLFSYTTPPVTSPTAPTDTFQAALNMAKYPGSNVYNILSMGATQSPFAPTLAVTAPTNTSTVNDLSIAIAYPNSTLNAASTTGIGLAIDSSDNIIVGGNIVSSTNNAAATAGNYLSVLSSPSAGATLSLAALPTSGVNAAATPQSAAVDANNTVWLSDSSGGDLIKIPNENAANATQILLTSPDGGTPSVTGTASTADVAQNTYAVAVDGSNNVWTTAYRSQGNCTNSGTPADKLCDLEYLPGGSGTTFTDTFGNTAALEYGSSNRYMAVDSSSNSSKGNIWIPDFGGIAATSDVGAVSIISPGTPATTGNPGTAATVTNVTISSGATGTYGSSPYGVALDAAGNGWVTANAAGATNTTALYLYNIPYNATSATTPTVATNSSPASINSTLNTPAKTTSPAAAPLFAVGGLNTPRNLAIDGAGNIFIANYGFKTLVEYSPAIGGYLSPNYGFAPSFATPVYVYSYAITSAGVATFNTPNNLLAGATVTLSGFTTANALFLNNQTVTLATAGPYSFTANVAGLTGYVSSTVTTTQDSGVATPTTNSPVTFTCTNSSSTNTCSLQNNFTVLGAVAIDKAGSVWTVGSNGTLIEMIGTAAPTDPLLSDGKYGVQP
jgi:hypothetical protein